MAGGTISMSREVKYLVFCMETYRHIKNMTGIQVYNHFVKYNFFEYIIDLFELLHIQGTKRLIEELDEYQYSQDLANI
jgi:hypothetical protein